MAIDPFELLSESDRMMKEATGDGLWGQLNDFLLGGLNVATTIKGDPVAELMGGSEKQLFKGGLNDGLLK